MTTNAVTNRYVLAAVAAAATVTLAGCGGQATPAATATAPAASPPAASPAVPSAPTGRRTEITVADGKVVGGLATVRVAAGTPVSLVVTSDKADEAHLHGYDRTLALTAGTPATLEFTADTPGVFEFELHGAELQLARIEVR